MKGKHSGDSGAFSRSGLVSGMNNSMENRMAEEARRRAERSEAILRAEGVPINNSLPVIETQDDAKRRAREEVAYRTLALLVVAIKGDCMDQAFVECLVREYGLQPCLTPRERAFVKNESPHEQDVINFKWRYESAWTLLWALRYVDKLAKPEAICDVQRAVAFMKERTAAQFVADARLRPLAEILDQADLIYRYDWAVVDARVKGTDVPAGLDPGVTYERHYALNWLVGYLDQEWDHITTDT
jgi:hypothetical protein